MDLVDGLWCSYKMYSRVIWMSVAQRTAIAPELQSGEIQVDAYLLDEQGYIVVNNRVVAELTLS